jgi:hypothetical protein
MHDRETTALMRTVLDELCGELPESASGIRLDVAVKLLEAVRQGKSSPADLRAAATEALPRAPTMWR